MSVQIKENTKPGDLYVNEHGEVYSLRNIYTMPSVTMKHVSTGRTVEGGVGSLNLKPFSSIKDLDRDKLIKIISRLSHECLAMLEMQIKLQERCASLEGKLFSRINSEK